MLKTSWILFLLVCSLSAMAQLRVVSLAPSITNQIYLLGAEDLLVGRTSFCTLAEKDEIEIVATAIDVNIEKVITLKPDIVFTSSLTKPQTINTFKKMGIKVEVYPYAKSWEDICTQFSELAENIGFTEISDSIISTQKQRLQTLISKTNLNNGKMLMQVGANPLFCAVPNTYMDDMIRFAGGTNIAGDLKMGSITREAVLMRNPDFIFIVTMGIVGNEEQANWKKYLSMSAAKNNQIFILDADKACSPTPVNFVDIVEDMERIVAGR